MSGSVPATCSSPIRSGRKKRQIRRRLRHLRPRSVVLLEDETELRLFPPLRAGWVLRGQAREVSLTGGNAQRVVFGALNSVTGHRLLLARQHDRGPDFQAFLEMIHHYDRAWQVVWLLDAAPSHTARRSQDLADALGMELLWLPKRCPELNGWEGLWGAAQDQVCANRQYQDIDDQLDRFLDYLHALSPRETLRKAGLLSANCWLST